MSMLVEMRVVELLNARLCHELVSPVGAINNGVELLDEEDPDFVRDAIQLIGQSARKASQRLQFYRFAYGTNASAGPGGAPASGRDLSLGLFEETKVRCDWQAGAATLPSDWQRLACNMLVLAGEALPRGGSVVVRPLRAGVSGIEVVAEGENVNITPEMRAGAGALGAGRRSHLADHPGLFRRPFGGPARRHAGTGRGRAATRHVPRRGGLSDVGGAI